MRIFFVAQRVPFPPDRGDKILTFNELRHLASRHEVHVFCLADGAADLKNTRGLDAIAASVTAVVAHPLRGRLRALAALATGSPLSVAALNEAELHRAIRAAAERLKPDLIYVFSSNVAQYAEPFSGVPRIMQFADLDSLKWKAYAASAAMPKRAIYALEGRRLLGYERKIAATFSHSLVCTQAEAADFRRLIPGVPLSVVGNGVDLDYFRSEGRAKRPGGIVFTGVMNYGANVDAVTWFCDEVLPLVQREVPEASFTICGSRPSREVMRLADRPGVRVTGAVPDVRPYLDEAELFAAPLRIARGIQNKVLEAMAMGLPVVCSTAAWRGTSIPAGEGILPADAPDLVAERLVMLLRNEGGRTEMARLARAAVEARFAWDRQLAELDRVIAEVVGCT